MGKWIASVLLLAVPGIAGGAELSVQEALLRAKPAVALVVSEVASEVMVKCPTGDQQRVIPTPLRETGTGWFIAPNGWMITNAHVVSPAHLPPKAIAEQQVEDGVRRACGDIGQQALSTVIARAQVKLNPSISVILSNGIRLPATVVRYSPPVAGKGMSGRDLALLRLDAADMPSLTLGDSSNAKIGDKLHILGFPGVVVSHELLSASAQVEASVTNGAISGFKQDIANQPVIQTDAPAAWGDSGGPAVGSQGEVLGVLTFVTLESGGQGGIVQGFNFVIPSAAIREFLKSTEVRLDETSRFNVAWHAGLADYFAGNYSRAEKHFAEANRLLPELPDVRRMTAEAKNPPARSFPWRTVATVLTVTVLGAGGGLLGMRWKRNRFRVRERATYAKSPVKIPASRHVTPEELQAGTSALDIEASRTVVAYCT